MTRGDGSHVANEAAERLRAMQPEDDWGDKFYAALEALWWALKGTEIPAQGTAPHQIMADLIEDVPYERRATVERIREHCEEPSSAIVEEPTLFYQIERRYIDDEEAAR
jgi:hypothetical protein